MIYLDFDDTLVSNVRLEDAFARFMPYPEDCESSSQKLTLRRDQSRQFHSQTIEKQIAYWVEQGGVYINDPVGGEYIAFTRPHAHEFILRCLILAPTSILTSGDTRFQTNVARHLNLPELNCYGRDRYKEVPHHQYNLLVDDLAARTFGVQQKMKALGFPGSIEGCDILYPTERHIQIPAWNGKNREDRYLPETLPKIEKLLESFLVNKACAYHLSNTAQTVK